MMKTEGIRSVPRLGFGTMRLPQKDKAIDIEQVKKMFDRFMRNGFTYFDTAYVYHGGKSEGVLKEALVKRYPRNRFTIADKMPGWLLKSDEDVGKIFEEQLRRAGVSFFDFYLLHDACANHTAFYNKFHCWDFAKKMKKLGKIRHFGFSYHDSPELLDRLLTEHPEVEFVQLQINYIDWENEIVQSRRCYETVRRHGKPVIIMEPVKGGTLASLSPELTAKMEAADPGKSPASWALRFCASLEGVMVILSGMSSEDQVKDNIATMKDPKPFNAEEKACLKEVLQSLQKAPRIGCTGCRYCVDGCPKKIKIPDIIRAYNTDLVYGDHDRARNFYRDLTADGHKASTCIRCGQCAGICPQHLPVPDLMKKAAEAFER